MTISSVKTGAVGVSLLAGNDAFDPAATWFIQRVAGTGSANTITLTSIPSTYQHLQLRCRILTAAGDYLYLRVNSDSGNNYGRHFLHGTGASAAAGGAASDSYFRFANLNTSTSSTQPEVSIIDFHDYASTTKNKTIRAFDGIDYNSSTAPTGTVTLSSAVWLNTNAISSITIGTINGSNFTTNTTIALYGFKGV